MALEYEKNLIYRYLVCIGLFAFGVMFMLQLEIVIAGIFLFFSASEFYMIWEETRGAGE